MAWTDSRISRQALIDILKAVASFDLDTHTITAALYDTGITPDKDDTAAHFAYNGSGGAWVSASHEIYDTAAGASWGAGGVNISTPVVQNNGSGVVQFDGVDTASGTNFTTQINDAGAAVNAMGCLVYDNTLTTPVADQGFCFNYFGGGASVAGGQLTIVWNASGIAQITV